jgi:type IV pilus biogenesis protein CpaD/CtpE
MSVKVLLAAVLGLSLVGCASQPISNLEANPVPANRILDTQYLNSSPNTGEVTVKRDSGFAGSACSTRVYVDGKHIADIRPAEKVVLYLPEGEHILSAEPNGICGGNMTEVKAVVKAGSHSNYRYGTSGNGSPSIYPTAF